MANGLPCTSTAQASSPSTYTLTRTAGSLTMRVSTSKVVNLELPSGMSAGRRVGQLRGEAGRRTTRTLQQDVLASSSSTMALRERAEGEVEHVERRSRELGDGRANTRRSDFMAITSNRNNVGDVLEDIEDLVAPGDGA